MLPNLDRIIRGLLYLYVFSFPFERLLFIERNGFIILLVLLTLWCLVNRQHFFVRTPVDLPLLVLVAWVGISLPFATFPPYSFHEFAKLLQQGLIFYVVVYFFRDTRDRGRMIALMIGSLAAVSLYGIWQFEAKPWLGQMVPGGRPYYLIESFLSSEVGLTTYLVTVIPVSAAVTAYAPLRWQRALAGGTTVVAILCQGLTFSRAGLLALLTEVAVFAFLLRKKTVTILAAGLCFLLIAVAVSMVLIDRNRSIPFIPGPAKFTAYNLEARFKVWRLGFEKLAKHPLVGIGFGKDNFFIATRTDPIYLEAEKADAETVPTPAGLHNTFLDMAVGAGVPAGLAYIWLMWTIGRAGLEHFCREKDHLLRIWDLTLVVLVVGVFVRNCFDHMWIGTMALLFWVIVGLSIQPTPSSAKDISSS